MSRERWTSKFTHMTIGKIWFLLGSWTEDFSFFQAAGGRLPAALFHTDPSNGRLTTQWVASSEWTSEKNQTENKRDKSLCYNLISEVTSHYFHHILFIRSKSLGPVYTYREVIPQGYEYQGVRITGSQFKSCPPQRPWAQCLSVSLHVMLCDLFLFPQFLLILPLWPWSKNIC